MKTRLLSLILALCLVVLGSCAYKPSTEPAGMDDYAYILDALRQW